MGKNTNRYNSLHRHIWNIYCINDIFFRIIKKYFIFQNDENATEDNATDAVEFSDDYDDAFATDGAELSDDYEAATAVDDLDAPSCC